jgi:hypothetical protein
MVQLTRTRDRLASVTKASKPWPFQSMRRNAMSQLEWSAAPARKITKGASPTGVWLRQKNETVPRWA